MLTVDELKQALPKNHKTNATQELADRINAIAGDPDIAREVRENFLSYATILIEGKFKLEDYLNAVTYCTFKIMGLTNRNAYAKTFVDRYTLLVARGTSEKDISAYVASYHSNKLVNIILEQAYIPIWLLNRDVYQKAINTQLRLMQNADSELVQTQAANSLLLHLKQPEVKKIELDVKMKDGGGLDDLRATLLELAQTQARMIADGAGAQTISRVPLRTVTVVEEITDVLALPAPVVVPVSMPVMKHGMTFDLKPESVTVPVKTSRPSLFDPLPTSAPKVPEDIKTPVANYARCCDSAIEDCDCVEPEHIFLPTLVDNPMPLKRVSLFDDPAGMP